MVREDVRQRPATATAIQGRLGRISQISVQQVSFFKLINRLAQTSLERSRAGIAAFTKGLSKTTFFLIRAIVKLTRACLDTIWGMLLGAIGACLGTLTGFVLAYWSPVGTKVADFISQQLPRLVPDTQIAVGSGILLFAAAGLGTAWGLTAAGGVGQQRRYLVAALMGLLGYGLGWLVWQAATPYPGIEGVAVLIAVAVALLTLGLGLPSHHLVHTVVASAGCTTVFAGLATFNLYPTALWNLFSISATPSWLELWAGIAFFGFLSVTVGFWLGVSYYLFVPFLRFLGWR